MIKKYWGLALLFFLSFILFSFGLFSSTSFQGDLGRDLYEIAKISYGNFTLLGAKGSFGGIYTAPYYFYLSTPAFILTGRHLNGVIFFNALLFSASLVFFSYHVGKKFGEMKAILAATALMLFPFFLFGARSPGNGFTHIPFFLVFLTILYFYDVNKFDWLKMGLFGLLLGGIFSSLFAYGSIAVPLLILVFFRLKDKKKFFLFMAGLAAAFSPLLLFELKNNFVMLKNTFIDKSCLAFVNNTNLPAGVKLNKNVFVNALDLATKMFPYANVNIFLMLLLSPIGALAFVFLALLLRFQYSFHYFFPFLTLLVFTALVTILKNKFAKAALVILIIIQILFFPKNYYHSAGRSYDLLEKRVETFLEKGWINKKDKFNVILIRKDDAPTPVGFEYRYFFLKNGYTPQNEFLYGQSQKLVIFSEKESVDLAGLKNWEMTEFDYSKVKKTSQFAPDPGMTVYLLEK